MSKKRSKNARKKVAKKRVQQRRQQADEPGPVPIEMPPGMAPVGAAPPVDTKAVEESWEDAYVPPEARTGAAAGTGGGGIRAFREGMRTRQRGEDATFWKKERPLWQWAIVFAVLGAAFWAWRSYGG